MLVLDFDGVIADSSREAWVVARRTFSDLFPGEAATDVGYERFLELMPLGNRAEDFGAALRAVLDGRAFAEQADWDAFREELGEAWAERFHRRFYEVRAMMAREDPRAWLALTPAFEPLVRVLGRRSGDQDYAIATSKDGASVARLLAAYGIEDLFPGDRIVDKEAGKDKAVHLRRLGRVAGAAPGSMTFVDDKLNHLDRVAPLGVRCVLAGWGYNGTRERRLAAARGYVVCELDEAERVLFDGSAGRGSRNPGE